MHPNHFRYPELKLSRHKKLYSVVAAIALEKSCQAFWLIASKEKKKSPARLDNAAWTKSEAIKPLLVFSQDEPTPNPLDTRLARSSRVCHLV